MQASHLISKLREQLRYLEQDVLRHDQQMKPAQQKQLADVERFNRSLFQQQGGKLLPCITQLAKQIDKLEQQLKLGAAMELINFSCARIEDQFTALRKAVSATGLDLKSIALQKQSRQQRYQRQQAKAHQNSEFSWIAQNVMHSSHQLYGELNKHHQWAARINDKIRQLTLQLDTCPQQDKITLQQQILATQARLGKCQQAISYIEERIQLLEHRHAKRSR